MLAEIRIANLGVIDASSLPLGPGLTVVTGETGAGKTMVVTALGLLLGDRADPGAVRSGASQARVEGVVAAQAPGFVAAVEETGGMIEDDSVVLARNVSAAGRSRGFVGGASVPIAVLGDVARPLVAIHGQSDQHRLLRSSAQREALDRFGGARVRRLLEDYTAAYDELLTVERTLAETLQGSRERAQEIEMLRFGLEQIAEVSPSAEEDDELAAEESRLGFADELRAAAEQAREALSSDTPDAADGLGNRGAARAALESVADHDPQVAELARRVAEVGYLLTDVATDVASYASAVETDPHRLAAVSERRAALASLRRRYGDSLTDVLEWSRTSALRLAELEGADDSVEDLRERREALRSRLAEVGTALSEARGEVAVELGDRVERELRHLAMPDARFSIEVRQRSVEAGPVATSGDADDERAGTAPLVIGERRVEFAAHGLDDVEMLLAANTGSGARALNRGASGGELSRVMLALEVALAATSPVPTFVFDEVDAGVGGKAGIEIGRRLAALAAHKQVLVVTHLAQVAAYADTHVVVRKSSDGSVTSSGLDLLDTQGREQELSRMLAGLESSDTALAHARELLESAEEGRARG